MIDVKLLLVVVVVVVDAVVVDVVVVIVIVVDLIVVDLVVVDLIVVVGEIVAENVTAVVLVVDRVDVVVNLLCDLSSFSYRSSYPVSRWQGGYDDDGNVLRFFS